MVFTGDIRSATQKKKLDALGEQLLGPSSFLRRFTPPNARYDTVFEVLAVHASPRREVTVFDLPEVFRQYDEYDGWDYWKIFVDDESYHEGHGHLYENFGIDPSRGCAVILRPDSHVSYVGPMDAYEEMDRFFAGFMIPQKQSETSGIGNGVTAKATNGVPQKGVDDAKVPNGVSSEATKPERGAMAL